MEPKDIVRAAWRASGLSQVKFARLIRKSQPMLSKYMSGAAIPPSDILILCMNRCGLLQQPDISAAVLAERIVRELSGASFAGTRTAIGHILDSIARGNDTIALRK
jgi:transcriptional regulator with XRE-family HTH domain